MGNQEITIRIKHIEKDPWQAVTLLDQREGWALVADDLRHTLWIPLKTGHIHPNDITKLFSRPESKGNE